MYERGLSLPPRERVLDIGGSHPMGEYWVPWHFCINRVAYVDAHSAMPAHRQLRLKRDLETVMTGLAEKVTTTHPVDHLADGGRGSFLTNAVASRLGMSAFNRLGYSAMEGQSALFVNDEVNWTMVGEVRAVRAHGAIVERAVGFLDREFNPQVFPKYNLDVHSIVTAHQIVAILAANNMIPQELEADFAQLEIGPDVLTQPLDYQWAEFRRRPQRP